jgi:hypothetical protein
MFEGLVRADTFSYFKHWTLRSVSITKTSKISITDQESNIYYAVLAGYDEYGTHQGFGSGSVFNRASGSGSGSVFGIRIRIQEGKNDPQKEKKFMF